MVLNVFQHLRADNKIKKVVPKRKRTYIGNRNSTLASPVVSKFLMRIQPFFCLNDIIKVNVYPHGNNLRDSIGRTGMPSCSAPDIQYPVTDQTVRVRLANPVKVDGNHEWSPCKP